MTRRVLVIDDQDDIRELAVVFLELDGSFSVTVAAGGEEGLSAAKSEQPDVILLDVMMPGMSGTEVQTLLRNEPATQHIPVVFLTGSGDRDRAELLALGALGVISKPFNPTTLAAELTGMLDAAGE